VLYTSHNAAAGFDAANIVVQALPTGARKIVQRGGYFGRYVASGHLVYVHEATLFAAPFDLERLEVTGQAVPVLEGVASAPTGVGVNGAAQRGRARSRSFCSKAWTNGSWLPPTPRTAIRSLPTSRDFGRSSGFFSSAIGVSICIRMANALPSHPHRLRHPRSRTKWCSPSTFSTSFAALCLLRLTSQCLPRSAPRFR